MHIKSSAFASVVFAMTAIGLASGAAFSPAPQTESPADRYAWADACKTCHADIHAAWQKTKHANAIDRLSTAEQLQGCVVCHTTGGTGKIEREGRFVNRGVQCEACHGAAAAHAADPTNRESLTRKPGAQVCEACHNDKSPSFRGFHYAGMVKLSHAR
jgi:RecJ-like exonuclease